VVMVRASMIYNRKLSTYNEVFAHQSKVAQERVAALMQEHT